MSVWGTVVSELPFSCYLVGLTLPSPWLGRSWESTAVRGDAVSGGWAGSATRAQLPRSPEDRVLGSSVASGMSAPDLSLQ